MPNVITSRANGSRKVAFECEGPSRTEQGHRDEININSLMRKYHRTGMLPSYGGMPSYGDFSAVGTYHEALNQVLAAQGEFATLPAELRKRFRNDPGELIAFLNDPANLEEAQRLGLVKPPPPAPEATLSESSVPDESPAETAETP